MFRRFGKFGSKIHELKSDIQSKARFDNQIVYDKEFLISWVNLSLKTSSPLFHHHTVVEDDSEEFEEIDLDDNNNGQIKSAERKKVNKTPEQNGQATKKLAKQNTISKKHHHRRQFIFEHVSGTLCSGETTAILGPSGCGKTSVIKCLNGNFKSRLNGKIHLYRKSYPLMANDATKQTDYKIRIAFIPQFDCFFDCLTVFETMLFTSRLVNDLHKMGRAEKRKFHSKQIKSILHSLDLSGALGTKTNQLSGGQKKRLSIAVEILNKPDVLILDEPTTGLDSFASFKCVQLINQLVKARKIYAVLMVLHQPSTITFNLIDKLYIMSRTGSIIYNGLTKDLIEFLEQIHIDLPIYTNPADLIIEIASGTDQRLLNKLTNSFSIPIEQYIRNIQDLTSLRYAHGEFRLSTGAVSTKSSAKTLKKVDKFDEIEEIKGTDNEDGSYLSQSGDGLTSWVLFEQAIKKSHFGFWSSFYNLTKRYIYLIFKDKALGRNRLIASIALGLFVGYMYGGEIGTTDGCSITHDYVQQRLIEISPNLNNMSLQDTNVFQSKSLAIVREYNSRQNTGVIDNTSNMFFILLVIVLTNLIPTLTNLSTEHSIISKKNNNLNFNYLPYFCSKVIVETMFTILVNLIFISITYYLANHPLEWMRFMLYAGVLLIFALIVHSIALIIASLFVNNFFATIYIGLIAVFPLLLYTGYLIKIFHMPEIFRIFSYIFPSYYTYEVMLISIFGTKRCSKNLETKRKLYDLKNLLRTIVLKTFDEQDDDEKDDGGSDQDASNDDSLGDFSNLFLGQKQAVVRRLKRAILSSDKLTDSGEKFERSSSRSGKDKHSERSKDEDISTINVDLIKPINDQLKQQSTTTTTTTSNLTLTGPTTFLSKYESTSDHLVSNDASNNALLSRLNESYMNGTSSSDASYTRSNGTLNDTSHIISKDRSSDGLAFKNNFNLSRSNRQSTGYYAHFNPTNLKQLVSNKNLVRFLRLTSSLNRSDLNDILIIQNLGQMMNAGDRSQLMMSNNLTLNINNLIKNITNQNMSEMSHRTGNIEMSTKVMTDDSSLIDDSNIKVTALLKLMANDSKIDGNYLKNKINKRLLNFSYFNDEDESNSTDIDLNQLGHQPTDQPIDGSTNDQADPEKSIFQSTTIANYGSIDAIDRTNASSDLEDEKSKEKPNDVDDEKLKENSNDSNKEKSNDLDDDKLKKNSSDSDDAKSIEQSNDHTEQSIDHSSGSNDEQSSVTPTITRNFDTSKSRSSNANKINIYRLPLDRNITYEQIPEYNIPADALLYLLDNFFKRIGVPVSKDDVELSDDDFDESFSSFSTFSFGPLATLCTDGEYTNSTRKRVMINLMRNRMQLLIRKK